MSKPVLQPVEELADRIAKEVKSAALGHKIGNPHAPELDWVVIVYTRDRARWAVWRSNMGMKFLMASLQSVMNLLFQHMQNKQQGK